jgi:cellulose/xylan binding protein with CBM9 domain
MKTIIIVLTLSAVALAESEAIIRSSRSDRDVAVDINPSSAFWKSAPAAFATDDNFGEPVPGLKTEIRSRWTDENLYILFICSYDKLWLKADPSTKTETNKLWDWDVAEAFIGSDFEQIRRYKEFELSPQGEWVDLDINLDSRASAGGIKWDSNLASEARIDRNAKIWYGVMRIPWTAIDTRKPAPGNKLRINFYRQQGPPPNRKQICWQPTQKTTFHVPESFGTLLLQP